MPAKKNIVTSQDGSKPLLNLTHEKFCEYFATHPEFFGNAVDTYLEVFDIDTSKPNHRLTASKCASSLLKNGIILARINFFLETRLGLNDAEVDRQLAFCIAQGADMRVKLAGIKEYNALRGRVKTKLELSFSDSSDEELNTELAALEEELAQSEALLKARKASAIVDVPGMPNLTDEQKAARASEEQSI